MRHGAIAKRAVPSRPSGAESHKTSGFTLNRLIFCGGEEVRAFLRRELFEHGGDPIPEGVDGSLGGLSQQRLEFREGHLDRVEIRTVGREIKQRCARQRPCGCRDCP
jgi:hypothetical protein